MTTSMTLSRIAPTPSLLSARSHARAPHSTEAYQGLTEVLRDLPNSATAWYKLALTQKLRGNTAAAAVSAQKALAREPGYTAALLLAADAMADSDPPSAKARLVANGSQRIL